MYEKLPKMVVQIHTNYVLIICSKISMVLRSGEAGVMHVSFGHILNVPSPNQQLDSCTFLQFSIVVNSKISLVFFH